MKYITFILLSFIICNAESQNSTSNLYPVVENNTFRMIDYNGNTVKGPFTVDEHYMYDSYGGSHETKSVMPYSKFIRFAENGKMGVISSSGDIVFPAKYDKIGDVYGSKKVMAEVCINGKWGLLKNDLSWFVNPEYDGVLATGYRDSTLYINVEKDSLWGTIDPTGKILIPCQFDAIVESTDSEGLWKVSKKDKYGLCNNSGKLVVPCEYDAIKTSYSGFSIGTKGNSYDLISSSGKIMSLPACYDAPEFYPNGYLKVKRTYDDLLLLDSTGRIVIDSCSYIEPLSFGMEILKNDQQGVMDYKGTWIIPFSSSRIDFYSERYKSDKVHIVKKDSLLGIFDRKGVLILPVTYQSIESTPIGLKLKKAGSWSLVDYNGVEISRVVNEYSFVDSTSYVYIENNKEGLKGYRSDKAIPAVYEKIIFSGIRNVFIVTEKEKEGLVNSRGEILVSPQYDDIRLPEENLNRNFINYSVCEGGDLYENKSGLPPDAFYVRKNGKTGIINLRGEIIIPVEYTNLDEFQGGLAFAVKNGNKMVITTSNREVKPIDSQLTDKLEIADTLVKVKRNKKWGLINTQGQWLVKAMYDSISNFDIHGVAMLYLSGNRGFVHSNGKVMIPPVSPNLVGYFQELGVIAEDIKIAAYLDSTGTVVWRKQLRSVVRSYDGKFPEALCVHNELETVEVFDDRSDEDKNVFKMPDCFYRLSNLRSLKIKDCRIDTLLPAMTNFKQLHYLELKSTSGKKCRMPKGIGSLVFLDSVITQGNILLTDEMKLLPGLAYISTSSSYLPVLPGLKSLNYSLLGDKLSGNMGKFEKLQHLTLQYLGHEFKYDPNTESNIYKPFNWRKYFKPIGKLSSLRTLCIVSFLYQESDTMFSLPNEVYQLKELRKISLAKPLFDTILPAIGNLKNLHYLDISTNCSKFPKEMAELVDLDTLILNGEVGIPGEVISFPNMRYINTSSCHLPLMPKLSYLKYNCDSLPVSILQCVNLDSLSLSINTNNDDSTILASFINCVKRASAIRSLKVIDISISNLRSDLIEPLIALAPSIVKMPNLKLLRIRADRLSQEEKEKLVSVYKNLHVGFDYVNPEW